MKTFKHTECNIFTKCTFDTSYTTISTIWSLVADTEGGKESEGVWEYGVEENIWTLKGRDNGGMEATA